MSPSCHLFLSLVKNWHRQHFQNIIWKFQAYIQACSCYILHKPTFSVGWQVQCTRSPYEHPYLASAFHLVWKQFTCKNKESLAPNRRVPAYCAPLIHLSHSCTQPGANFIHSLNCSLSLPHLHLLLDTRIPPASRYYLKTNTHNGHNYSCQ